MKKTGKRTYYGKASRHIEHIYTKNKQPFLIHKYLDNYYRNVHRHLDHQYNQSRNVAREIRDHIDRRWWESIKSWTHYQRNKEDAAERKQGLFPEHEDLIFTILGDSWKDQARRLNK